MGANLISQLLLAVFGVVFGALVAKWISRNREKVVLAFDMHKEFSAVDMAKHRRIAARLIEQYPSTGFGLLCHLEEEKSISVLMIMRFYQRLWLSIKYKQVKTALVNELFGEVFYYWYYLSYQFNLIHLDWAAASQMQQLAEWFEKHDKTKLFISERKLQEGTYYARVEKLKT